MWTVALGLFLSLSCGAGSRTASHVLRDAHQAMGTDGLASIQYSGTTSEFSVGQSERAGGPWPRIVDLNVTHVTDFMKGVTHSTIEVLPSSPMGPPPPPPDAAGKPPSGPPHFEVVIDGNSPWMQQMDVWTTPWGFLNGAMANPTTLETRTIDGRDYEIVSWTTQQKAPSGIPYRLSGYFNDQHILEKVETKVENPFLGDVPVEVAFSEYRDIDGVKVPAKIVQRHGGWPRIETTITSVTPNPSNIAQLMKAPPSREGQPPAGQGAVPPQTRSEQLAPGVYRITGGYVSLGVEFTDHIVIIEGPENDARADAIMAEAKRVIPNKPIKYVVNTHHHDDHAGGLHAFAAEGATIVTHETNRAFLDRVLNTPRTLVSDRLSSSKRRAQVEAVGDVRILKDASRVVELHHVKGLAHADGMLIAYLPKERIIVQADMGFIVPFPIPREGRTKTLVQNLERLKLDYDTVVFVHAPDPDRRVSKADLLKLAAEGY